MMMDIIQVDLSSAKDMIEVSFSHAVNVAEAVTAVDCPPSIGRHHSLLQCMHSFDAS